MDFITGLQNAIDYVEKHIVKKIDFDEVAKQANLSNFQFQRIFSNVFGYSLSEYIRLRRLSLAGSEVAQEGSKIMNIALKYGYETQETFSRTFAKFHGVKPAAAKRGAELKTFPKFSVEQISKENLALNYRIEEKPAFNVVLRKKRFSKAQEVTEKDVARFWSECNADGTVKAISKYFNAENYFAGCTLGLNIEPTLAAPNNVAYGIGVHCNDEKIAENYLTVEKVPENTYAVFECKGSVSESLPKAYKYIFTEFFTASEYQPCGVALESYPAGDVKNDDYSYEIWVAVKKKN